MEKRKFNLIIQYQIIDFAAFGYNSKFNLSKKLVNAICKIETRKEWS